MTKKEWLDKQGLTDDEGYIIQGWMYYYNGIITAINDKLNYETIKINS